MKMICIFVVGLVLFSSCKKKAAHVSSTPTSENVASKEIDPMDYVWTLQAIRDEAYQLSKVEELREKLRGSRTTGESTLFAMDLKKASDELDRLKEAADKSLEALQTKLSATDDKEGNNKNAALLGFRTNILDAAEDYASKGVAAGWEARQKEYFRLGRLDLEAVVQEFYIPAPF
jgi:PBP1b-binding outer membrane lipoprotein LpoB